MTTIERASVRMMRELLNVPEVARAELLAGLLVAEAGAVGLSLEQVLELVKKLDAETRALEGQSG